MQPCHCWNNSAEGLSLEVLITNTLTKSVSIFKEYAYGNLPISNNQDSQEILSILSVQWDILFFFPRLKNDSILITLSKLIDLKLDSWISLHECLVAIAANFFPVTFFFPEITCCQIFIKSIGRATQPLNQRTRVIQSWDKLENNIENLNKDF